MRGLKAYTHITEELDMEGKYALYAYDVDGNRTKIDDTELLYLKSEADAEIAELKSTIAELKKERDWLAKDRAQAYNDLEKRAQLNIKQEESIRHHKYMRCLAKAEICRQALRRLNPIMHGWNFYSRWRKRWFAIADKFKEAK